MAGSLEEKLHAAFVEIAEWVLGVRVLVSGN
jgi:hypothetical protein